MTPRWAAWATASVRPIASSLSISEPTWNLAVWTEIPSRWAMVLLEVPSASSSRTLQFARRQHCVGVYWSRVLRQDQPNNGLLAGGGQLHTGKVRQARRSVDPQDQGRRSQPQSRWIVEHPFSINFRDSHRPGVYLHRLASPPQAKTNRPADAVGTKRTK